MDGIDVAVLETDGIGVSGFGPVRAFEYSAPERAVLRQAIEDARTMTSRHERPGALARAEAIVTARHAEAITDLCAGNGLDINTIDIIGFHGQTVLHRPSEGLTVQIGDARELALRVGRPVVCDLRQNDVANGGQGAPLVPVFHRALAQHAELDLPAAFLNLGGVANITYVGADGSLLAFDTGPANALLDDWALAHTGVPVDVDARLAAAGQVDRERLSRLMGDPYFGVAAPKSLDRDHFRVLAAQVLEGLAPQEGAATLAAFTVESVHAALAHLPDAPRIWVVSGGGVANPVLMSGLCDRLQVPVVAAEELGFSSPFMEAQAFAYLGVRALHALAITFPMTTGAPRPLTGGRIVYPPAGW